MEFSEKQVLSIESRHLTGGSPPPDPRSHPPINLASNIEIGMISKSAKKDGTRIVHQCRLQ